MRDLLRVDEYFNVRVFLSEAHRISSGGRTETSREPQTSSWSRVWPGCSWSPWCRSSVSAGTFPPLVNLRTAPVKILHSPHICGFKF